MLMQLGLTLCVRLYLAVEDFELGKQLLMLVIRRLIEHFLLKRLNWSDLDIVSIVVYVKSCIDIITSKA